jgi:hypothetical protein
MSGKMSIEEYKEKMEELFDECEKVLAQFKGDTLAELKESKKEGRWKPALDKLYWYRGDEGINLFDTWENDEIDEWRRKNLKIFETEEECEKYWHFMDTVKEKSYEFSKEEIEKQQPKYCIYYDYGDERFAITDTFNYKYFGEIYFKTYEDAQYIIDNFKDELMEYWI